MRWFGAPHRAGLGGLGEVGQDGQGCVGSGLGWVWVWAGFWEIRFKVVGVEQSIVD